MRPSVLAVSAVTLLCASTAFAQASKAQNNEFAMMTWPEVKAAIAAGKTTALVYTAQDGGRGPRLIGPQGHDQHAVAQ